MLPYDRIGKSYGLIIFLIKPDPWQYIPKHQIVIWLDKSLKNFSRKSVDYPIDYHTLMAMPLITRCATLLRATCRLSDLQVINLLKDMLKDQLS